MNGGGSGVQMDAHPEVDAEQPDEPPAIRDRRDSGGRWSTVVPLASLGLIGLMILHACVVSSPSVPAAVPAVTGTPAKR
jgi:hypothetical protein